ncbi:MAG: GerW family sporulation protein [Saprospirales bacterium]|nr:GerW family sporulation protein [Saprospirales bacterium]MBK8921603.1 GerW family sporulation protein [Saprospirales bacterium]
MKTNFDDVLSKVTEFLQGEAKTETVVGKEFKLGEFTCVPVIRLGMGFGYGGGEGGDAKAGRGEGSGAGAGLGVEPIGFLVTRGAEISFLQTRSSKGLTAAFEKVPDLIEKYLEKQVAEKKESAAV